MDAPLPWKHKSNQIFIDVMIKLQVKIYSVQNFVKIRDGRLNSLFGPYRE